MPEPTDQRHPLLRWGPVVVLIAAAVAVALIVRANGYYHYKVEFQDAGQLVKGNLIRIGGNSVGTVTAIDLSADSQALVSIKVKRSYGRLHQGTTAVVRQSGLASVAGRYIDLSPGPGFRPALADGTTITADKTTSIVDLDQLFNTFDPETRKGLQNIIDGSASWYDGHEHDANRAAEQFPRALAGLSAVAEQLTADNDVFQRFLVKTGDAMSALAARRGELTELVSNSRATAQGLGSGTQSLSTALTELPPALRQGSRTLADVRPALKDLQRLVDATGPATQDLEPFLRRLTPVLERATPTIAQLRAMFAQPGAHDDLLDALRDLPVIDRQSRTGFPNAQRALHDSSPVFSFVRPYVPDLVGWVRNFGQAMAPYDANGHYARTEPVFDSYRLTDTPQGGELVPKDAAERGRGDALSTGNLRRCPGASMPAAADGSAPFVDDGPLAKPDCDTRQRPRNAP